MGLDLLLALDHEEIGPQIRACRVLPPDERLPGARISRIREKMEAAKAYGDGDKTGLLNRAKLEEAMEDGSKMLDLEGEWLSDEERFRLGFWQDDSTDFIAHPEAELILQHIVRTYRRDLAGFRIGVVMQRKIPPSLGRGRLGTATKLPGKMAYLSEWDAIVTLDFKHWRNLTDKDRQRLIHHELEHLTVNDVGTGLRLVSHDFEDFASIVERYGLRSESKAFSTDGRTADVLEAWGAQLELVPAEAD
jgi:hypothetical protein